MRLDFANMGSTLSVRNVARVNSLPMPYGSATPDSRTVHTSVFSAAQQTQVSTMLLLWKGVLVLGCNIAAMCNLPSRTLPLKRQRKARLTCGTSTDH
eukprot:4544499-Amphidinium_carterae.2